MSKYWSELTKRLDPYIPGEQPKDKKYIKLNTNENPYPPSPKVIECIKNAAGEDLKLYPDPNCEMLKDSIAEYFSLDTDQVFVGNGSDEVLAFSFQAFFNPEEPILFPDITYSFYPVYSNIFGISYINVPLDGEFSIPVEEFSRNNGGIIIANPNAPTGKYLPIESVKEILENNINKVVIIDEAYIDFGGESAVSLINSFPNLLVIQTLSKSRSLAGLRVGFALGNKELIEGLERVKNSINSYTLDRIAILGGTEAIKDKEYFEITRNKVIDTRDRITKALQELRFNVIESKANFVFISHPEISAEEMFYYLKDRGILVRYFNKPKIDNYLRVSVGTDEEMNTLIETLKMKIV